MSGSDELKEKRKHYTRGLPGLYRHFGKIHESMVENSETLGKKDEKRAGYTKDFAKKMKSLTNATMRFCLQMAEGNPGFNWLLENVKGLDKKLAALIICVIEDIEFFKHISSLWSWAGFSPGKGRREGKEDNYNHDLKYFVSVAVRESQKSGNKTFYGQVFIHFLNTEINKLKGFIRSLKEVVDRVGREEDDEEWAGEILGELTECEEKIEDGTLSQEEFDDLVAHCAKELGFENQGKGKAYLIQRRAYKFLAILIDSGKVVNDPRKIDESIFGAPAIEREHQENRAYRQVGKLLLQHLWVEWRTARGLPVTDSWVHKRFPGVKKDQIHPPRGKQAKFTPPSK